MISVKHRNETSISSFNKSHNSSSTLVGKTVRRSFGGLKVGAYIVLIKVIEEDLLR